MTHPTGSVSTSAIACVDKTNLPRWCESMRGRVGLQDSRLAAETPWRSSGNKRVHSCAGTRGPTLHYRPHVTRGPHHPSRVQARRPVAMATWRPTRSRVRPGSLWSSYCSLAGAGLEAGQRCWPPREAAPAMTPRFSAIGAVYEWCICCDLACL